MHCNIAGWERDHYIMGFNIQLVSAFLDSHWARSQILRTAQFAAATVSGLLESASPDVASKLIAASSKISGARVILRLMDDIPILVYNLSSIKVRKVCPLFDYKPASFAQRDASVPERAADILVSLANQLYYPVEHTAWAADQGLLPVQSSRFWLLSNILWMVSLVISLTQTLVTLFTLTHKLRVMRRKGAFSDDTSRQAGFDTLRGQLLQALASAADLMLAIHWMPSGFPGAGCLGTLGMGVFGLISSLIGLYKMVLSSKR